MSEFIKRTTVRGEGGSKVWYNGQGKMRFCQGKSKRTLFQTKSGHPVSGIPPTTTFVCLLIFLGSLYCKQYGPRSECSQGSRLFWTKIVAG